MDHIDWTPIADIPEHLKDGRSLLLWCEGGAMVGSYWQGGWISGNGDVEPTHFAEINPPGECDG
jgi:hypothetical protein